MPEPLDPITALTAIRTYATIALANDEPTLHGYELILREIVNACDQALPKRAAAGDRGSKGEEE